MSLRCEEPGWIEVDRPDGHRGVWLRVSATAIELCSGREGDDGYVRLEVGQQPTERQVTELCGVLTDYAFALDNAALA